jgi:hypothetical protein
MEAFFWLSDNTGNSHPKYREGLERLSKQIGMKAIYAHAAPRDQPLMEWVSEQLTRVEFAFFDVTAANQDCLIALGMAVENDAQWFALRNPDARPAFEAQLVSRVRDYYTPDDFGLKVRTIIEEVSGATTIQHRQLVEKIKQKVAKHGLLPLKGIAQELGYRPDEIRPVVYSMVAEKMLTKVSDKRWAKYAVRS